MSYVHIVRKGGERMPGKPRGFAAMSKEKRREIASKGGSMSPGNFKFDRERARVAGEKGGRE